MHVFKYNIVNISGSVSWLRSILVWVWQ